LRDIKACDDNRDTGRETWKLGIELAILQLRSSVTVEHTDWQDELLNAYLIVNEQEVPVETAVRVKGSVH